MLVVFYDWLNDKKDEVLAKLPALKAHYDKIRALPKVAEQLKSKTPQTIYAYP